MRQHTTKGNSNWGERKAEHKRQEKEDIATHNSFEVEWNEVHKRCQPCISIPDGPAAPGVLKAADLITAALRDENITG